MIILEITSNILFSLCFFHYSCFRHPNHSILYLCNTQIKKLFRCFKFSNCTFTFAIYILSYLIQGYQKQSTKKWHSIHLYKKDTHLQTISIHKSVPFLIFYYMFLLLARFLRCKLYSQYSFVPSSSNAINSKSLSSSSTASTAA